LDILAHSAVIFLAMAIHVKGEIELGECAAGKADYSSSDVGKCDYFPKIAKQREMKQLNSAL